MFGLFILIEGIRKAGVIDAAAQLFYTLSGDDPFRLYTLLVFVSVGLSAFIDNIPYVATMLPVVQSIAGLMNGGAGFPPELFYFGLLTGATLGGILTPIGASANIAAIGILRKQGEQVRTRDFLRIIIEQANVPVVVDAGIGAPSHAAEAMEMGASACLVNTAIAVAGDPVAMAVAFRQAVEAGRMAYEAGLGLQTDSFVAEASSPLTAFLND